MIYLSQKRVEFWFIHLHATPPIAERRAILHRHIAYNYARGSSAHEVWVTVGSQN
jgi:hypothetical protein